MSVEGDIYFVPLRKRTRKNILFSRNSRQQFKMIAVLRHSIYNRPYNYFT
jgi:hypothetical protein